MRKKVKKFDIESVLFPTLVIVGFSASMWYMYKKNKLVALIKEKTNG